MVLTRGCKKKDTSFLRYSRPKCIAVQSLSRVQFFVTPWTAARQAFLSFANFWNLLKLMSIEPVMPFNYLILCHPLLVLPSISPCIRVFSNELARHIRWPKYRRFSISPSKYSGLVSFGLTVLISLLPKGLSKVFFCTTIWRYQFFRVQPSLWSNSHILTWLLEKP